MNGKCHLHKISDTLAMALGNIKDSRSITPLIKLLKDKDDDLRKRAIEALGCIQDTNAVEPLLDFILKKKNSYGSLRDDAKRNLYKINNWHKTKTARKFVPKLIKELEHDFQFAADALALVGDRRAIKPLIIKLTSGELAVRYEAECAIHTIEPNWHNTNYAQECVPLLITKLKDGQISERKAAANILGSIKNDKRVIKNLISALRDINSDVKETAADALYRLTKEDFGNNYEMWNIWLKEID